MDAFPVRGCHHGKADSVGPFCDSGKKQQVHYISVKLPLSKGVLNYTSLVCAAPCNCHSLRPYWLKTTAVDRPVAAAGFEKVGRYIVPPYLSKGQIQ